MSKYTTMLRWPVEQKLDDLGLDHTEDNWPQVYEMLGLSDYPIYEEAHRQVLNDKIIRRYYFREIGFETVGQFRWQMRSYMHEIMPYYNQLYQSEGLVTDPMLSKSMDYAEGWSTSGTEEGTRSESGRNDYTGNIEVSGATHDEGESKTDTTTSGTTTSDDRNVFQDTPMNGLDTGAIEAMDYATNVTFDHGETTSGSTSYTEGTTSNDGTEQRSTNETNSTATTLDVGTSNKSGETGSRTHNEKGFDRPQSDILLTYRQTILNIDLEIVNRLDILFIGLW